MKDYCEDQTGYMQEGFASSPYSGCDEGIILGFETIIFSSMLVFLFSVGGLYAYIKKPRVRILINRIFSKVKK